MVTAETKITRVGLLAIRRVACAALRLILPESAGGVWDPRVGRRSRLRGPERSRKIAERQRVGGQGLAGFCPRAVCHASGGMLGSAKPRSVDLLIAGGGSSRPTQSTVADERISSIETVVCCSGKGQPGAGIVADQHVYRDEGSYNVRLTLRDDDTGEASQTARSRNCAVVTGCGPCSIV